MTEAEIIQAKLVTSSLLFTRYFFKHRFKRKFVVNHHHETICNALDRVLSGELKRLIICIAPRYGKTELAVKNFVANGLAINPSSKFIHLSYSQTLALDNSEEVREFINTDEYRRIFPYVKMDKSSTAKNKWYTTEGGGIYATATGGQITGFGAGEVDEEEDDFEEFTTNSTHRFAGAIIIDDALKPDDALSETKREKVNERFENTIRSRTNSRNTPIVIIGQRLHEKDLIGYLLEEEPDEWTVINLPAISVVDGKEVPLWEFKHTIKELYKIKSSNESVFDTQYQQDPKEVKGKLLPKSKLSFQDLSSLTPQDYVYSFSVGDPANTGGDNYSMMFIWVLSEGGNLRFAVKDVVYSQDGIEALTPRIIDRLQKNSIEDTFLEANGVGLAAYLQLKGKIENHTNLKPFNTKENKEVKILSNYEFIKKYFIFDSNYKENDEYVKFIAHLTSYNRNDDNKHKIDAIDNASMASKILKIKYREILFQ